MRDKDATALEGFFEIVAKTVFVGAGCNSLLFATAIAILTTYSPLGWLV